MIRRPPRSTLDRSSAASDVYKRQWAACDISLDSGAYFPVFTFGGLRVRPGGEVLSEDGEVVAGLYSAGRNCCGLPRCGATYSSGMSIGDASFFGRHAGRNAASSPLRSMQNRD